MIYHQVSARRSTLTRVTGDRAPVSHILDFADKLRETGAPLKVQVECSRNPETLHLVGLTVRYSEELEDTPSD